MTTQSLSRPTTARSMSSTLYVFADERRRVKCSKAIGLAGKGTPINQPLEQIIKA
jgi:hypothetical protein